MYWGCIGELLGTWRNKGEAREKLGKNGEFGEEWRIWVLGHGRAWPQNALVGLWFPSSAGPIKVCMCVSERWVVLTSIGLYYPNLYTTFL